MRKVLAADLAKRIGLSRWGMRRWCERNPEIAYQDGRRWWVRLDRLESKGLDLITAVTLMNRRWIKATTLAKLAGRTRFAVAVWRRRKPSMFCRIGTMWYVDIDNFTENQEYADALAKLAGIPGTETLEE